MADANVVPLHAVSVKGMRLQSYSNLLRCEPPVCAPEGSLIYVEAHNGKVCHTKYYEHACDCVYGTAAQPPTPDQRADGQHRGLVPEAALYVDFRRSGPSTPSAVWCILRARRVSGRKRRQSAAQRATYSPSP
jgi:hypothetical protein